MATTLSAQIGALATQVGTDIKQIIANVGDLSSLTTTQKASLVVALNELKSTIDSVAGSVGETINDSATSTSQTWSSSKISTSISEAVNALVAGAPDAMDTLKELADAISANGDAIGALQTIAAGHVKFDSAQTISSKQQQQARTNIGAVGTAELTAVDTKVGALTSLDTTDKSSVVAAINEVLVQAAKGVADAASAASAAASAQQAASTAQTTATGAQQAVAALQTNVGDTQADFVAVYTAARGSV